MLITDFPKRYKDTLLPDPIETARLHLDNIRRKLRRLEVNCEILYLGSGNNPLSFVIY